MDGREYFSSLYNLQKNLESQIDSLLLARQNVSFLGFYASRSGAREEECGSLGVQVTIVNLTTQPVFRILVCTKKCREHACLTGIETYLN